MRHWIDKRATAALLTGLLAGGITATGATALAVGAGSGAPESAPAAPLTCVPVEDTGGSVSFGVLRPRAQ